MGENDEAVIGFMGAAYINVSEVRRFRSLLVAAFGAQFPVPSYARTCTSLRGCSDLLVIALVWTR